MLIKIYFHPPNLRQFETISTNMFLKIFVLIFFSVNFQVLGGHIFCLLSLLPGVNFTNVLQASFMRADPKSATKLINLTVFFALLGSARLKATRRLLVKLTPGQKMPWVASSSSQGGEGEEEERLYQCGSSIFLCQLSTSAALLTDPLFKRHFLNGTCCVGDEI